MACDKKYIVIQNMHTDDTYFYLSSTEDVYKSEIINGSTTFNIYNTNNHQLYLTDLNINDRIKIYYKNNIIKKIIINTKYIIDSDSEISDDLDIIN